MKEHPAQLGNGLGRKSFDAWFDYAYEKLESFGPEEWNGDSSAVDVASMLPELPKNVLHGLIVDLGRGFAGDPFFSKLAYSLEKSGIRKDKSGFYVGR